MPAVAVVGGGSRRWPMDPQLGALGNPAAKRRPTAELFRFTDLAPKTTTPLSCPRSELYTMHWYL